MNKFLEDHWIWLVSLVLLIFMFGSLLYFGSILRALGQRDVAVNHLQLGAASQVGICLNDLTESRWIAERNIWERQAKESGLTLQIRIAHRSLQRQIRQIRVLVRRKIKVLILVPVNYEGLEGVLGEASRQGVKIILYDGLAKGAVDYYCGPDYRQMGRAQAEAMLKLAGGGNYGLLKGLSGNSRAEQINQGQMEFLRGPAKKRVKVMTMALTDATMKSNGFKLRPYLVQGKLKAILAPDDSIAVALDRFLEEQKLPTPFLGGMGAEFSFEQRIEIAGKRMSLRIDYLFLAREVLGMAQDLLKREPLQTNATIRVGSRKIPARVLRHYSILQKGNLAI